MADALQTAIAQDDTTTATGADADTGTALDVDVSSGLFEAFDGRAEDLFWFEATDGALLAADDGRRPDTVARLTLDAEGVTVDLLDAGDADLRRARTLSTPGDETNPQFD